VHNLKAAVALHFMHYNFARIHQSLRVTPSMEAGATDHLLSVEDIVALLDQEDSKTDPLPRAGAP
jgi:hypothetical protein